MKTYKIKITPNLAIEKTYLKFVSDELRNDREVVLLHQCLQGGHGLLGHHGAVWSHYRKVIPAIHQSHAGRTRSQDCGA